MGDIMAQIGRYKWGVNMVGTTQDNWTRVGAKATVDKMMKKKETHKLNIWQHNTLTLGFAAWSDNAVVKLLNNFYPSIIYYHQR